MGFITPILLGGAALMAAPIVLHLVMRRRPREIEFPALRFVQQRREANRRQLQLRHLLLLTLRCLLIVGVATALARPTLKGVGLRGKEGAPLAVALVFDNSLRMEYVRQNRTRLEESIDAAKGLVAQLPEESAVAIGELGRGAGAFAPDLNAAEARIGNLKTVANPLPLAEVVVNAIAQAADLDEHRQEVIVFTDFAATALSAASTQAISEALIEAPDVRIYFVDVGIEDPQQAFLGEARIRRALLRSGETLQIETEVVAPGEATSVLAELYLQAKNGESQKRGEQLAAMTEEGRALAQFEVADLPLGIHQGYVQLPIADPLAMDNTRYFTVEVRPSAQILLLADRPTDAMTVRTALEALGQSYACTVQTFSNIDFVAWDQFDAALLLDPPTLPPSAWDGVAEFSSAGGGVGIWLGHNAASKTFNTAAPQKLLPGTLKRISREPTYLRPSRLDHPALAGLRNAAEGIPWQLCQVWAFWQFDALSSDAYVVAEYANGQPAIIEAPSGQGRLLTITTPFSDPAAPEGRQPWNVLPSVPWPFVGLCDQITSYLAQDFEQQLNYLAGATATITLGPRQQVTNYVLRMPDGQAYPRVAAGDQMLSMSTTDELGNYRVTAGGGRVDRGFSMNAAPELSDLTRVDPREVAAALPPDRVQLAANLADAEKLVGVGRAGRELYRWAILLVAVVWSAEHVLANRFYRTAN